MEHREKVCRVREKERVCKREREEESVLREKERVCKSDGEECVSGVGGECVR